MYTLMFDVKKRQEFISCIKTDFVQDSVLLVVLVKLYQGLQIFRTLVKIDVMLV